MKKNELINTLKVQQLCTKKPTRQKIISVIIDSVNKNINDIDNINGLTASQKTNGVNLGDVMEVVVKKCMLSSVGIDTHELTRDLTKKVLELDKNLTPKKLTKNGTPYKNGALDHNQAVYSYVIKHDLMDKKGDLIVNGVSYELKFSTSDSPATPLKNTKAKKVIVTTWTASSGGLVFECEPSQVVVDHRGRVINNQKAKYINHELTKLVFGE